MKKQEKILLWPVYFDSSKTRQQGRRVSKSLAVASPKLEEIQKAAKDMGFQAEVVINVKYPKTPWQKTGYILIPKKGSKTQMLREIAKKLISTRKQVRV